MEEQTKVYSFKELEDLYNNKEIHEEYWYAYWPTNGHKENNKPAFSPGKELKLQIEFAKKIQEDFENQIWYGTSTTKIGNIE